MKLVTSNITHEVVIKLFKEMWELDGNRWESGVIWRKIPHEIQAYWIIILHTNSVFLFYNDVIKLNKKQLKKLYIEMLDFKNKYLNTYARKSTPTN